MSSKYSMHFHCRKQIYHFYKQLILVKKTFSKSEDEQQVFTSIVTVVKKC